MLSALLCLPSLATLQVASARPGPEWPAAWQDGAVHELSLEQLSAILAGVPPGTPGAASLQAGLARLKDLPPVYSDVARATLEGLASALWHQQQAMAKLTPGQTQVLLAAQHGPIPPEGQASPALQDALASLDFSEVRAAQAALQQASAAVLALLAQPHADGTVTQALAKALGVPAPAAPATPLPAKSPAQLLDALQATSGPPLDAQEKRALQQGLAGMPDGARAAVGGILDALRPFASGTPADSTSALLALGQAIDQARPVLQVWGGLVTADQLWRLHGAPPLQVPDPRTGVPPLRFGLPSLTDGRLPRAPSLADALRAAAASVGDTATAQDAAGLVAPLSSLAPAQQDAIAQVWSATAQFVLAQRLAASIPVPPALQRDPALPDQWHKALASGSLPAPGTPAAQDLLAALPYLESRRGSATAQQDLLVAAEQLVPAFSRSQSSAAPDQCFQNGLSRFRLAGYLSLDLCGADSTWLQEDQALLVLDAGGDNFYGGRFGGAPFRFATGAPELGGLATVAMPVSLTFDVGGGSNTYLSTAPCAQGAACPGLDAGPDPTALPGNVGGTANPDPTTASNLAPIGILVDWKPDGSVATDRFTAAGRSQGYAGRAGADAASDPFTDRSLGILVERVGDHGTLRSTFTAGHLAQGSAVNGNSTAVADNVPQHDGEGLLLRLVGEGAASEARLTAGNFAQGASTGSLNGQAVGFRPLALGALLTVAGRGATSNTNYTAGHHAQGSTRSNLPRTDGQQTPDKAAGTYALFVDVAGPGARRDNTYTATDHARGDVEISNFYTPVVTVVPGILVVPATPGSPPAVAAFVSGVAPPLSDPAKAAAVHGLVIDAQVPTPVPGSSDDTYSPVAHGWGRGGGIFLDVSGDDRYPACSGRDCPANDTRWNLTALDTRALDANGDLFPRAVGDLWGQFVHLWDNGSPGSTVLPAPGHVLLNLDGTQLHLDEPYAFVLSAASTQTSPLSDWYGPSFSASVHIDLGGHDLYEGRAGAAFGVAQRVQELPQADVDAAANAVGGATGVTVQAPTLPVASPPRSEAAPFQNHFLSFSLNTQGGNRYESLLGGNQGFGAEGAAGLLFTLGGNDRYSAPVAAQGVGLSHGLGVLVDLQDPGAPVPNWFHVGQAPRHGTGQGGGLGILAANGAHNTFQDGPRADPVPAALPVVSTQPGPDGPADGTMPGGVSYNGGSNAGPGSLVWDGPLGDAGGPLQVNTPYTFAARAVDPEGDPLTFCWTFQHATPGPNGGNTTLCAPETLTGAAQVPYAWTAVATNDTVDAIAESVEERVTLTVTDTGGQVAGLARTYGVRNLPLTIPGPGLLLGERSPRAGDVPYAYQLPFTPGPAGEEPSLLVDWDDGLGARAVLPTVGGLPFPYNIDWAAQAQGGVLQIPDGYANAPTLRACCGDGAGRSLQGALNEGAAPPTLLQHNPPPNGSLGGIDALVSFAGPRQVGRVVLKVASIDSAPMELSLDGIGADGAMQHLGIGTLAVPAGVALGPPETLAFTLDLPALPAFQGLQLSQVLSPATQEAHTLRVVVVQAFGPGALHAWPVPGAHNVSATLVNHFGGVSHPAQPTRVVVTGNADEGGDAETALTPVGGPPICTASPAARSGPIRFENIGGQSRGLPAGRGPVCHASLVGGTPYSLSLRSNTLQGGTLDIDWGDGTGVTGLTVPPKTAPDTLIYASTTPGRHFLPMKEDASRSGWAPRAEDYEVKVTYRPEGGTPRTFPLTTIHVEQGLDLRIVPETVAAKDPANSLTNDGLQQPEVPLLYVVLGDEPTWHEGIPFVGIVDAGGADRFTGKVAAPVLLPGTGLNQGARPGLVIAGPGSHDYLSSDARDCLAADTGTQGFGSFGSVGFLLSLGDDRFVAHGCAQGAGAYAGIGTLIHLGGDAWFNPLLATDPLVAAGYGSSAAPWESRPAALATPRPPTPRPGMDYLQGAGLDGVGVLVNSGGHGSFNAYSHAQGYGGHMLADPTGYASPECPPDEVGTFCAAGVNHLPEPLNAQNWLATFVGELQGNRPPPGCPPIFTLNNAGQPTPIPQPCPPLDSTGLKEFLAHGPRYGPGLGLLVQGDGAASLLGVEQVQGASGRFGHGLLLGTEGALVAAATARAQAHTDADAGTAALVLGGPSVLRLQRDGQGNPGSSASTAILFGLQRDQQCDTGHDCPPAAALPPQAVEQALLSVLPTGLGVPGPGITVTGLPTSVVTSAPVTLQVDLSSSDAMQALGPAADGFELAVVRATRAWSAADLGQVSAGASPTPCNGPLLAPPTLLLHATGLAARTILPAMDPAAAAPGAQPDVLAGCTEVVLWARQALATGSSAWSLSRKVVHFLPPPRSFTGPQALFSDGEAVAFAVRVLDPLAATQWPTLTFRLAGCTTPGGQACTFGAGAWSGDQVEATLDPGSMPQAGAFPDGAYRLQVRAAWPGRQETSPWVDLAAAAIDRRPPVAVLDRLTEASGPLPAVWKLGKALLPAGHVHSRAPPQVFLRILDDAGQPLPLQVPAPDPACPANDCLRAAVLPPARGIAYTWQAMLAPQDSFPGGPVRVQTRVLTAAHDFGWVNGPSLLLDGAAPIVAGVDTAHGGHASSDRRDLAVKVGVADTFARGCLESCPAGTGVEPAAVQALLVNLGLDGARRVVPLQREPSLDASGVLGFAWHAGADIPEGVYQVEAMARDAVGNLRVLLPGQAIIVDQHAPTLGVPVATLPRFQAPNGQTVQQDAVRSGSQVMVSVPVQDAFGTAAVEVRMASGAHIPLAPQTTPVTPVPTYTGVVPITLADAVAGTVPLQVAATDLAGNEAVRGIAIPFSRASCAPEGLAADPRSDALSFTWTLPQGASQLFEISGPGGTVVVPVREVPPGAHSYRAQVKGLPETTAFLARLRTWDGAGCLESQVLPAMTQSAPLGTRVALAAFPAGVTRSGVITVHGVVVHPPMRANLTLHLGHADGPTLAFMNISGSVLDLPFALAWDSAADLPANARAANVTLVAVLDDGLGTFVGSATLRVDNAPPDLPIAIVGPEPSNGWYAGTLRLTAVPFDDTPPLDAQISSDGGTTFLAGNATTLASDGTHEVRLRVTDGATPPNVATVAQQFKVDLTAPTLSARMPVRNTQELAVPLVVSASDALSGIDAYRLRSDGGEWGAWTPVAPSRALVAPGRDREVWVDVQVRDVAGNVAQESSTFTLDRMAPRLLAARWVGWTAAVPRQPVLLVAAQDVMDGVGRPAGVDAVRFAPPGGAWGAWIPTDGGQAFPLDAGTYGPAGLRVQLRDAAGNIADPAAVAAPPAPAAAVALTPGTAGPASARVAATVDPPQGTAATRFLFSAVVATNATEPTVFVDVDGVRHAMAPSGPRLQDGSQLYVAALTLAPTQLESPHQFRVVAVVQGVETASQLAPGPFVAIVDNQKLEAQGAGKGMPAPGVPAMLVLLALAALLAPRARRGRGGAP
ncbi:MAG TPA: hypothetical protein VM241_04120 [Candidatus Thermoplasmatota archaeon]|nr:hypothetical protein [Candidatus Thermoplasmatota archaeon]